MPIKKSAKKAIRQNIARKPNNTRKKTKVRSLVKQIRTLVVQQKTEDAQKLLPKIYKALDKAAKAGVMKKNTAARRKSRLTKLLQKTS